MSIEVLYPLITEAIRRAETLEDLHAPGAVSAYLDLSLLEERAAEILPASDPEGALARRGAVRAALAAKELTRAQQLAERFLTETETDADLRAELLQFVKQAERSNSTGDPHVGTPDGGVAPGALLTANPLFLSYGRRDAKGLADRLRADLTARGYDVWQDTREIVAGSPWDHVVQDALARSEALIAVLSPHAVRTVADSADTLDSVCRDEISYARRHRKPIVPVMAVPCDPPIPISRLDYVDLTSWESPEEYQAGFQRLLDALETALKSEVRYWAQLDAWNFDPFLDEKRQHFCGREWLFEEINAWRRTSDERALLITGDPGAGKSSIVAELVTRNPANQVLAYHFCQADTGDTLQPGRFVRSVAAMLASRLPAYAAALEQPAVAEVLTPGMSDADPASAFERGVLAPLARLGAPPGDGDRYLLVDALDEALLGGKRGLTIVDVLAPRLDRLPPWLRLVATTRKDRGVLDRLKGLRVRTLDAQDPRNLADLDEYLAWRLAKPPFPARLAASGADPALVHRLLGEKSEGNFLYAQQALQGIERDLYDPARLDKLPPGLAGLYGQFFKRQYPDEAAYAVPRRALELILAAREPLSEAQLARMGEIEPATLVSALRGLGSYLQETEGRFTLYHLSLADWLTEPRLAGDHLVSREKGRERLLAYCRRWRDGNDDYAFLHFPAHLAEAGAVDELKALLLDGAFLKMQIEHLHDPFAEEDDFGTLVAALLDAGRDEEVAPLAVTENPYRRDGVVLALEAARREAAPRIERIVRTLLSTEDSSRRWLWRGEPSAPVVGARRAAVRVAYTKETLLRAAEDPSPAVRGALVPYLFRFWEDRREPGWELVAELCERVSGRFGLPDRVALEIAGGLSLAILGAHAHDDEVLAPLRGQWQLILRRSLESPLVKLLGRRWALSVGTGAFRLMMAHQPDHSRSTGRSFPPRSRYRPSTIGPRCACWSTWKRPRRAWRACSMCYSTAPSLSTSTSCWWPSERSSCWARATPGA